MSTHRAPCTEPLAPEDRYIPSRAVVQDCLGRTVRMFPLLANPDLRVVRYDATHLLPPSEAQLKAEARRAQRRRDWETRGWRG